MDGTSSPSATVTVSIVVNSYKPNPTGELRYGSRPIYASIFPLSLLGMIAVGKKRRAKLVLLLVVFGAAMFSVNCGAKTNGSVAPGTYQVTVTGASTGANAVSHSTAVTLTVT